MGAGEIDTRQSLTSRLCRCSHNDRSHAVPGFDGDCCVGDCRCTQFRPHAQPQPTRLEPVADCLCGHEPHRLTCPHRMCGCSVYRARTRGNA